MHRFIDGDDRMQLTLDRDAPPRSKGKHAEAISITQFLIECPRPIEVLSAALGQRSLARASRIAQFVP
jgi:hypothetical protein